MACQPRIILRAVLAAIALAIFIIMGVGIYRVDHFFWRLAIGTQPFSLLCTALACFILNTVLIIVADVITTKGRCKSALIGTIVVDTVLTLLFVALFFGLCGRGYSQGGTVDTKVFDYLGTFQNTKEYFDAVMWFGNSFMGAEDPNYRKYVDQRTIEISGPLICFTVFWLGVYIAWCVLLFGQPQGQPTTTTDGWTQQID